MQVTSELAALPPNESVIPAQAGIHISSRFQHSLARLLFPSPLNMPVAVALSGGADSMALALLADGWARAQGGTLVTLTVDHGLRAESAAEALQVQAWMRARGIAHRILTPAPREDIPNLQESARTRRYDALADYCRAHDILHCLVAHHAGDQRETVALHTARGDTADGGSGMSAARNHRGVRFLRPLLTIEPADLENHLRTHGVAWIDDPSNRNPDFARVRMRAALASNPEQSNALSLHAATAGHARAARDEALAQAAMRLVTLHPAGFTELPLAGWHALEPTLASQLLADLLTTIGGAIHRPRTNDTQRLAAALAPAMRKRTLHQCEVTCTNGTIRIAREMVRVESPVTFSGSGTFVWDGRFHVHHALPDGVHLTLKALGSAGKKQLMPRLPRGASAPPLSTPSLWHLDELHAVPHITHGDTHPNHAHVSLGFAPAKPLAAAPFWWLN